MATTKQTAPRFINGTAKSMATSTDYMAAKQKGTPWHFLTRVRGLAGIDSFHIHKLCFNHD